MRPAPLSVLQRAAQRGGRNLAPLPRQSNELDAAAEEFRRAAFVDRDMRFRMTQHRAPRGRQMRERERIRGRSGRHQEYRDILLENLRKAPLDPLGPVVIAVTER